MAVTVTDGRFFSAEMIEAFRDRNINPVLCPSKTEEQLIRCAADAEAVITTSAPFSRRVIDKMTRCKIIVRCGIGVDNIDVDAASEKGIYVANTPGSYAEEVSDHVIALMLALSRRIVLCDRLLKEGAYAFDLIRPARRMSGKILGIVGFGRIGKLVAKKAGPFGMRCLVFDPYYDENHREDGLVELASLEDVLTKCDFLALCCPLSPETEGMIGEAQLKMMKPDSYLINAARGRLIDEAAMVRTLEAGLIAGAGFDAVVREPPRKEDPLLQFENVIVTPHIAWYSEESLSQMSVQAAKEVCRVLDGSPPENALNRDFLKMISTA